jgi:hypothetical protein
MTCDDWGADLRCLCSGGGRELRLGLGERSWSAITRTQAQNQQLRTGSEGAFDWGSRRGNQSDGVEGNRRPIRDRTILGERRGGGATGVHRICGRIAHKVCFRQRTLLHINLSEGPPQRICSYSSVDFIYTGRFEGGRSQQPSVLQKKVADSEISVSLSNYESRSSH